MGQSWYILCRKSPKNTRETEIVPAVYAGNNKKAIGIATGIQAGRMKIMNGIIQALNGGDKKMNSGIGSCRVASENTRLTKIVQQLNDESDGFFHGEGLGSVHPETAFKIPKLKRCTPNNGHLGIQH